MTVTLVPFWLLINILFGQIKPHLLDVGDILSTDLFEYNDPLSLQISGDLKGLFNDRTDNPQYFPLEITHVASDSILETIQLKAKTRGHSRLKLANCKYPPILLNFSKQKTPDKSTFFGQNKLKLVVPCRGDQYVIQEYLAYKIYNLITDFSFRVRLVKIDFNDNIRNKIYDPVYGFLLEDVNQLASRHKSKLIKRNGLNGISMNKEAYLTLTVFQYLIGNTDWSVEYQHNIRLFSSKRSNLPIPVPYDFDHAGLVAAPYANPAAELGLKSVRERRYRGYCMENLAILDPILENFITLKSEIIQTVKEMELLDQKRKNQLLDYIDRFYKILDNPKQKIAAFTYPCLTNGTGNVVIKGLK